MTFEEYLHSLPDDQRLNILQYLKQFGEHGAVLKELAAMQPCVQNEKLDVRINHKYFFWHNKSFLERANTSLMPMDSIKYCYHG